MANPFVHVELHTDDPAAAKNFYADLFDWTFDDVPMGDSVYTMIRVGEGTGGGIIPKPSPETPSLWLPYVEVDDVGAATSKAQELGATVAQPETEIPPGRFSVIIDPTGATIALWQSKPER